SVDAATRSMVLSPSAAKLALGLSSAETPLQVMGENITSAPGTGYLTLGSTQQLHMQMDRNDIRVAGPGNSKFGTLYLQRFGGPLVVHAAQPLASRVYVTSDGDVGIGTSDPMMYAENSKLAAWSPDAQPGGILAVRRRIFTDIVAARRL